MRGRSLLLSLLACTPAPRDPAGAAAVDAVPAASGRSGSVEGLESFGAGSRRGPPPAPSWIASVEGLESFGAGSRAHRLAARAVTAPLGAPSPALPAVVSLSAWEPVTDAQALHLGLRHQARLPAPVPGPGRRFAPPGTSVTHDDRPLTWHFGGPGPGWRVDGDRVLVAWPGDGPPPALTWRGPGPSRDAARLDPEGARLTAEGAPPDAIDPAWSEAWWSVDHDRRRGLLVPAGGAVALADLDAPGELRAAVVAARGAAVTVTVFGPDGPLGERRATSGAFEAWTLPVPAGPLRIEASGAPGDLAFVAHPIVVPTPREPPRRIVWIGLDTTRPDHLGFNGASPSPSPALDALAGRSTVFTDAVAPAPRTRPSFRAALTGRAPLDQVGGRDVFDALGEAGFVTAGLVANPHLDPTLGFGARADRWLVDPDQTADVQVDRAIAWLGDHADHDAALFLHLMDPHLPYSAPEPWFERLAEPGPSALPARLSRRDVFARMDDGALTDADRDRLRARYRGEIAFLDHHVGRLLAAIDALPGPTLIVVHSDHGEELWDRGGFEHNHSLAPEVVDAVLLIHLPGQAAGARTDAAASLEDVAPTVLSLLGLPSSGAGRDLTPALRGQALPDRPRGVAHLMYGTERWGVRARGHSYVLHTASGREELYDRRVDPQERIDLAASADLEPFRRALAAAHAMDVGPGWRVAFALSGPVAVALPAPALRAGIVDPEATRQIRANRVWGVPPALMPDDVGSARLTDGGRRLEIVPGPVGEGLVWVRFAAPTPIGGRALAGATGQPLHQGRATFAEGWIEASAGTVLIAPRDEASQLADSASGAPPASHVEALRALGYLDGE